MKSEWQAHHAQVEFYRAHQWQGDLGPKRAAHVRPSLLSRLIGWFL